MYWPEGLDDIHQEALEHVERKFQEIGLEMFDTHSFKFDNLVIDLFTQDLHCTLWKVRTRTIDMNSIRSSCVMWPKQEDTTFETKAALYLPMHQRPEDVVGPYCDLNKYSVEECLVPFSNVISLLTSLKKYEESLQKKFHSLK